MGTVSVVTLLAIAGWVALCGVGGWSIYRGRERTGPLPERAFVLAAIMLLAVAPVIWLVVRLASNETSFFAGGVQAVVAFAMLAAAWRARRQRESGKGSLLHFPEKSALLVLVALILVFGSFVLQAIGAGPEQAGKAFLQSLGIFIAVMIIGHAIIALFHAPIGDVDRAPDERDQRVRLLSSRNAYYLLTAGFWSIPVMLVAGLPLSHLLIGWFVVLLVSEILYYGSVLFYYRFGQV